MFRVTTRHLAAGSALAFVGSTLAGSVVGLPGALAASGLAEASVGGRALSSLSSSDVVSAAVTAGSGEVSVVAMVAGNAPVQIVTPVPELAAAAAGTTAVAATELSAEALGIPAPLLDAYKKAAALKNQQLPSCQIDWTLLAAIGKVESNHAQGGKVDAAGNTAGTIQGPMTAYGTAKGPMQFIDSSWKAFGADGNGDGVKNVNNIYDAALGAANHLCASGGGSLKNANNLYKGIYGYNHADWYVQKVLALANQYSGGTVVATAPATGAVTSAPSTTTTTTTTPSTPSPSTPSTPSPTTPTPTTPAPTTPETPTEPTEPTTTEPPVTVDRNVRPTAPAKLDPTPSSTPAPATQDAPAAKETATSEAVPAE